MKVEPASNLKSAWTSLLRYRAARLRRMSPEPVDYRDRISIVTWPILFGLALSLFFALPTVEFSFVAFGSPATVPLTGTFLVAFALAVLAAAGAESVVSTHPRFATAALREGGRTWPFWALPMALTIIFTLILPRLPTPLIQVLVLALAAVIFVAAFFSLYLSIEPGRIGFRRSRLILNIMTYAAAVALFLFVYQTRTRSLVSSTLVGTTAMLLAIELLRGNATSTWTVIGYGAIVGLLLGEVTWALNYWPLPNLTGGVILLLLFYVSVTVAQNGLQDRLTLRLLIELLVVIAVTLLLLALLGPGFTVVN